MDDKGGIYTLWCKSMEVYQTFLAFFENNTTVRVGNGSKTFWEDKWLGHASVKNLLPEMYVMAVHQQMSLADSWTQQGQNIQLEGILKTRKL
ncbi:hypothetical protein H5410_005926 [Solanum commersonii]|uniref:Uncharacterized protein n=1 Tax=Solanum commersonii TaxID=4109 RepID=A0A9J6A8U6_SOLCO|nr:hypothetical protein H5410_005926 [Solanum commersonii]